MSENKFTFKRGALNLDFCFLMQLSPTPLNLTIGLLLISKEKSQSQLYFSITYKKLGEISPQNDDSR